MLPSERTLRDYRHHSPAKSGFSNSFDLQLLECVRTTKPLDLVKYITVLVDEMYVREGVVYRKSTGDLTGFVELSDIDTYLDEYERWSLQGSKKPKS